MLRPDGGSAGAIGLRGAVRNEGLPIELFGSKAVKDGRVAIILTLDGLVRGSRHGAVKKPGVFGWSLREHPGPCRDGGVAHLVRRRCTSTCATLIPAGPLSGHFSALGRRSATRCATLACATGGGPRTAAIRIPVVPTRALADGLGLVIEGAATVSRASQVALGHQACLAIVFKRPLTSQTSF